MSEKLRKLILVIAIVVFIVSLWQLVSIILSYRTGTNEYDELAEIAFVTETPAEPETEVETTPQAETSAADYEETTTEEIITEAPTAAAVTGIDYPTLKGMNQDFIGWIYIEGTLVSYPIVQTDNNDYYLNHTFNGTSNSAGAIFMEHLLAEGLETKNCIIYGHNMLNGSMFGTLKRYKSKAFYDQHRYVQIFHEGGVYNYEIFAAYTVKGASSDTYTYGFGSESSFMEYIDKMNAYSDYNTGVEVLPEDKIITLSTCTNRGADRYVIQAKRLP